MSARYVGSEIEFANAGGRAAKLSVMGPIDGTPWNAGLVGWVLPGSAMRFAVPAKPPRVRVSVNGVETVLAVQ